MGRVLGLDFGSNSIGWAIVDIEKKEIINMGCKIYENSIDEVNVNGITVSNKSEKRERKALILSKIPRFVLKNQSFLALLFLQIVTISLMLINLHDWRFWFSISFAVLIALLGSSNKFQK